MSSDMIIAVFMGGDSAEREIALASGKAAFEAIERSFRAESYDITERVIPEGISSESHVVFLTTHGVFGEDGGLQSLLEEKGISYAGCDAFSSKLCFDKRLTSEKVASLGMEVTKEVLIGSESSVQVCELMEELGDDLVVKPNCQGSSVGLHFAKGEESIQEVLSNLDLKEEWLMQQRVSGRELTVGVFDGEAGGVVEIRPKSGAYDYKSKYTKGMTDYLMPAPLDERLTREIQESAVAVFRACGCRDWARVDYMLRPDGKFVFLEVNTLPGLTETSLLPMSARMLGLDFDSLLVSLLKPAIQRFQQAYERLPR